MPGSVGTDVIANTRRAHRLPEPHYLSDAELHERVPPRTRTARLIRAGLLTECASPDELRLLLARIGTDFRDKGLSI